jgi:hypothetical protein
MSGAILSVAAFDFCRMAVHRNRGSGVTAIGIRARPNSKSPDGVVFLMRARQKSSMPGKRLWFLGCAR